MNNADMPAIPVNATQQDYHEATGDSSVKGYAKSQLGLTKREMFAMHFMAAWIQHHGSLNNNYRFNHKDAAICAIEYADALLREL